jgi:dCMP deaminase
MLPSKFADAHMKAAEVYSQLSSAVRLKVGCVVVKNDTIIGIGYNGMPSGWDNNCEDYSELDSNGNPILVTKPEVLHSETNALAKIARSTNSSDGASMFITHAPCLDCAKLVYQSGIKSVYYRTSYRNTAGIDFLNKCNVQVIMI